MTEFYRKIAHIINMGPSRVACKSKLHEVKFQSDPLPNSRQVVLTLYGGFGSVMAPIWGATFAWLYVGFLPKSQANAIRAARRARQEQERINPRHIPQEFRNGPWDQTATAT